MPKTEILTATQQRLLNALGKSKFVTDNFYLSGGTALTAFYIPYRYSEDLDFFSLQEVDPSALTIFWKSQQKILGISKVEYQQSFNRHFYFLTLGEEVLKTEFTYYPFPRIETSRKEFGLEIDGLLDIAVNKLFTIYQQSRARDFMDLYMICREKKWTTAELTAKAKIKFDWHLDPIQLGAQFFKAEEVKDYPRLLEPLDDKAWQDFFRAEAEKLKSEILE